MISERKLVASHSSFWREAMPLGDSFVRFMNSSYDRFNIPRESLLKSNRNSLVSELSFRLFNASVELGFDFFAAAPGNALIKSLTEKVEQYIARLDPRVIISPMTAEEIVEAKYWARSLKFFTINVCAGKNILIEPKFYGCGIIDQCEGDILIGKTLWELKNVERDFRIADVRQLLTYCALNYASEQYQIESVGLVNARLGICFQINLTSLSTMAAAMSESELLGAIVRYITMDAPSR
jgi:hypothetical protein